MKKVMILLLCLLLMMVSGCTTKKDSDVSPDGGADLTVIKQAAIDVGCEVSDDYSAGTGEKLPKVLGGFRMIYKNDAHTVEMNMLEFEYSQYAAEYATGQGDMGAKELCRTSGRFVAEYMVSGDFSTDSEVAELLDEVFESVKK